LRFLDSSFSFSVKTGAAVYAGAKSGECKKGMPHCSFNGSRTLAQQTLDGVADWEF
jgi:hypothetical protein